MKYRFIAIVIILLSGCKSEKYVEIRGFEKSFDISGNTLEFQSESLFPRKMVMFNSSTIAVTDVYSEYGVNIYSICGDSINLSCAFGHKVDVPNEGRFNANTLQKDVRNGKEGLWIGYNRWVQFHTFDNVANSWQQESLEKLNPPKSLYPLTSCFVIQNDDLTGITTSLNHQVFIVRNNKNDVEEYDFFPVDPNPYGALDSKTYFNGVMEIKPDKSKFVIAYSQFKSLSIVDFSELTHPLKIKFKDTPLPVISKPEDMKTLALQYISLCLTDNYIYALYAGKQVSELENAEDLSSLLSVQVFNWEGKALYELKLDRIINSFCVDEGNQCLYGINPLGIDNSEWYRFVLPQQMFNN